MELNSYLTFNQNATKILLEMMSNSFKLTIVKLDGLKLHVPCIMFNQLHLSKDPEGISAVYQSCWWGSDSGGGGGWVEGEVGRKVHNAETRKIITEFSYTGPSLGLSIGQMYRYDTSIDTNY